MVKPWKYRDAISGDEIEISVSHLYTTLRVNNRCYYFRADDGKFDGTSTDKTIRTSPSPLPSQGADALIAESGGHGEKVSS